MMELNRDRIIKMLETIDEVGDCSRDCIFYNGKVHSCGGTIAKHALALIKELTEENSNLDDTIACLKIELETVKADAVRKMQKRLTSDEFYIVADDYDGMQYVDFCAWVDDIVKEMLEENK